MVINVLDSLWFLIHFCWAPWHARRDDLARSCRLLHCLRGRKEPFKGGWDAKYTASKNLQSKSVLFWGVPIARIILHWGLFWGPVLLKPPYMCHTLGHNFNSYIIESICPNQGLLEALGEPPGPQTSTQANMVTRPSHLSRTEALGASIAT